MVSLTDIKTTKKTLTNLETEVLFIGIHKGKKLNSTEKALDNVLGGSLCRVIDVEKFNG